MGVSNDDDDDDGWVRGQREVGATHIRQTFSIIVIVIAIADVAENPMFISERSY